MFRVDSEQDHAFRMEVRAWLEANLPRHMRHQIHTPTPDDIQEWHHALYKRGWIAPHWPKKYGGMEATLNEQIILNDELTRIGAPQIYGAINFLAPVLMEWGTEAQKAQHLPGILDGSVRWAQGSSEPGAGSDLAGLTTRAALTGDRFVVNGQKIWNTGAHFADWMYALVRTDPDARPKHAGISIVMFPMDLPGISRRSIKNIVGDDDFATVFFDDLEVPKENLLGPLHGGWKVISSVLGFERYNFGNPTPCIVAMNRVKQMAALSGAADDPAFRDRMAQLDLDITALSALFSHAVALNTAGTVLGAEASMMKLMGTETLQKVVDLVNEAAAACGAVTGGIPVADDLVEAAELFVQTRRSGIHGGANEIHRNVLAKRVLALPGEPKPAPSPG